MRAGALGGFCYGAYLAACLWLAMLVDADEVGRGFTVPPAKLALFEVLACTGIGLSSAFFEPFVRSRQGNWLLGFLLALPVAAIGIPMLSIDFLRGTEGWIVTALVALLVGPMTADILRDKK